MNKQVQKIILVAAMAHNRVIGRHNQLPWQMPADMQHFRETTTAKPIVMGRKTFESIGSPLPKRRNIIVSQQANLTLPGCEVVSSVEAALDLLKNEPEIMIIGGEQIFRLSLPYATHMILTFIDADIAGDTFFPAWPAELWYEVKAEKHTADADNPHDYTFVWYEKC